MPLSKAERLALFYEALRTAPPAGSFEEAFALLRDQLNAVEDMHSGVPHDPGHWETDGRIYPPQWDAMILSDEANGLWEFANLKHVTAIAGNGALEIRLRRDQSVVFTKAGADGRQVAEIRDRGFAP